MVKKDVIRAENKKLKAENKALTEQVEKLNHSCRILYKTIYALIWVNKGE